MPRYVIYVYESLIEEGSTYRVIEAPNLEYARKETFDLGDSLVYDTLYSPYFEIAIERAALYPEGDVDEELYQLICENRQYQIYEIDEDKALGVSTYELNSLLNENPAEFVKNYTWIGQHI